MEALGVGIGLKTVCIVGGIDMFQQVTKKKKRKTTVWKELRLVGRREGG